MTDDDDALAGIDLHVWRVPLPPGDGRAIVQRAFAPPPAATPRRTLVWVLVGTVLVNAAFAAVLAIVVPRAAAPAPVVVEPAGSPLDPEVMALLQRLDAERLELERRLAEIDQLRALVTQLDDRLRRYEALKPVPVPTPTPSPTPTPTPSPTPSPSPTPCDEVSCVLDDYAGACCASHHPPHHPPPAPPHGELPDTLDREIISAAMAVVHDRVAACGAQIAAHGKVKIHVRVDPTGAVTGVDVNETPDVALGSCIAIAVHGARFAATERGGSFSYPYVF